eukprot:147834-Amphidinium_carterae.2
MELLWFNCYGLLDPRSEAHAAKSTMPKTVTFLENLVVMELKVKELVAGNESISMKNKVGKSNTNMP